MAAALVATSLSVLVFAVLSASGDRAIVANIGPSGPFADLHHTMPLRLVRLGCWFAAISGGAGVLAGLAAVRYGWRPSPGRVLAACAVMCGCSEMQEVQNNGGHGVNFLQTDKEVRAGY